MLPGKGLQLVFRVMVRVGFLVLGLGLYTVVLRLAL